MKSFWERYKIYAVNIGIALAVGGLAALITRGSMESYAELVQPPLSPPGWLFPIVWTILYILMGISAAMIQKKGTTQVCGALLVYYVQLAVNFFWPIIYFKLEARLAALIWLIALLLLVIYMKKLFRAISPSAAALQIPYLLWLVFAAYLNFGTYILNR